MLLNLYFRRDTNSIINGSIAILIVVSKSLLRQTWAHCVVRFSKKALEAQRGKFSGKNTWKCVKDMQHGRHGLIPASWLQ